MLKGFRTKGLSFISKGPKSKFDYCGIRYWWSHRPPNPDPSSLFGLEHAGKHAHLIFENNCRRVVLLKTNESTKKHELECVLNFDIDSLIGGVAGNINLYSKNQIPESLRRCIVNVPDMNVLMEYIDKVITEDDVPKLMNGISRMSVNTLLRQNKYAIGSNQNILAISLPETLLVMNLKAMEKPILNTLAPLVAQLKKADYLRPQQIPNFDAF